MAKRRKCCGRKQACCFPSLKEHMTCLLCVGGLKRRPFFLSLVHKSNQHSSLASRTELYAMSKCILLVPLLIAMYMACTISAQGMYHRVYRLHLHHSFCILQSGFVFFCTIAILQCSKIGTTTRFHSEDEQDAVHSCICILHITSPRWNCPLLSEDQRNCSDGEKAEKLPCADKTIVLSACSRVGFYFQQLTIFHFTTHHS